jgi:hypothetical protein
VERKRSREGKEKKQEQEIRNDKGTVGGKEKEAGVGSEKEAREGKEKDRKRNDN